MQTITLHSALKALHDGTESQRQRAADDLGHLRDPAAQEALLSALDTERTMHVRWVIVRSLGRQRCRAAVPRLEALLLNERTPHHIRYQAGIALVQIQRRSFDLNAFIRTSAHIDDWLPTSSVTAIPRPETPPDALDTRETAIIPVEVDLTFDDLRLGATEQGESSPAAAAGAAVTAMLDAVGVSHPNEAVRSPHEEAAPSAAPSRTPLHLLLLRVSQVAQWRPFRADVVERRLDEFTAELAMPPSLGVMRANQGPARRSTILPARLLAEVESAIASARPEVRAAVQALLDKARSIDVAQDAEREMVEKLFTTILNRRDLPISQTQRQRLYEAIMTEILGHGPLAPLLADPDVTEILINGHADLYYVVKGQTRRAEVAFEDTAHLTRIIDRIIAPMGYRLDESQPILEVRLPDGTRINILMPPFALNGPTITIRRFGTRRLEMKDLVRFGTFTEETAEFVRACVFSRLNILISGGTASGKTAVQNVFASFIPEDERIVVIEHESFLRLHQPNVVMLEVGSVHENRLLTYADLVRSAMRMLLPDRLVFGEFQKGEDALEALQALNQGHGGSLMSIHATSTRDALGRLEVLCRMANTPLTDAVLRELIAANLDMQVHQERLRDGSRRVIEIAGVKGIRDDQIEMYPIFEYEQTGYEGGRIVGRLRPTGIRPHFIGQIEDAGIALPPRLFGIGGRR